MLYQHYNQARNYARTAVIVVQIFGLMDVADTKAIDFACQ